MPVTDQGNLSSKYTVIPRVLIFITSGSYILLIKGAPTKHLWADLYNGIGGHIEPGEDIITAGRRELLEETGLNVLNLALCGVIVIDTGINPGIAIYVLSAEISLQELIVSSEGEPQWFPISNLEGLPMVEDIPIILPLVINRKIGDPPFSAAYHYTPDGTLEINIAE